MIKRLLIAMLRPLIIPIIREEMKSRQMNRETVAGMICQYHNFCEARRAQAQKLEDARSESCLITILSRSPYSREKQVENVPS